MWSFYRVCMTDCFITQISR
uniref:Uncharacterized protein n=1 Tax=Arundo donax TaxID=35708 RepID=A0A0A8ZC51_ARUDO